jgi:hypothetical protein
MPRENKSILRPKQTVKMTSTMSSAVSFSKKDFIPDESLPKVGKEVKIESVPEQKLPTPKDILRLRYMRFRAVDLDSTIDFYTTIGMNVEFKSDQELWTDPNAGQRRNTTNQTPGRSKATERPKPVPPKSQKKAVVGLSFKAPGSTSLEQYENIQIIFEKDDKPSEPVTIDTENRSRQKNL